MKFSNLKGFICGLFVLLGSSSLVVFANDASVLNPCFSVERSDIEDGVKIVDYLCNETTVDIPDEIDLQKVVEIGDSAFKNKGLTSVIFPSSLIEIGNFSFANNALTRIKIPEGVTSVGEGAFKNNQLSILEIPESLKVIKVDAFRKNKLKKVIVPGRLNTIDEGAFCDNASSSVEGVSESLEWNFGKACFSLKRASLLEDSYAISDSDEEGEMSDENGDDETDHSVILEEIDSEFDEQVSNEDNYEGDDNEDFDNLGEVSDEKSKDEVALNFSIDSLFGGIMSFGVGNIDGMDMLNTFSIYVGIIIYFVSVLFALYPISAWEIYRKAGKKGWAFLVPIYGTMIYTEIGGVSRWLGLIPWFSVGIRYLVDYIPVSVYSITLMVLGIVTFFWWIIVTYRIARRYHWNIISSVCFVLFFPITLLILGLGNFQYIMYREEEQSVEADIPVLEPVVATEQLNNVVEHFVGADENVSDSTVDEITNEDKSTEVNISSQEDASVVIGEEMDGQEKGLQNDNGEGEYSQSDLSSPNAESSISQDNKEQQEISQSMEIKEESSLPNEPISDLDQLLANNKS